MSDQLAREFEAHRTHLHAVAYRMLGSASDADDAVQEAWLRLSRTDPASIDNIGGWLTTVVSRVCLDMLRSRRARREDPLEDRPELAGADVRSAAAGPLAGDPEHEAQLADAVGLALLVVLDTLDPAERLAFVLHDLFAVPFDEIAAIVDRTPVAARQLASRARRRVQQASPSAAPARGRRRDIVAAFLAASRGGHFDALLALLDPDAVVRADDTVVRFGAEALVVGASGVAATFNGRARAARLALVDGLPAAVWFAGGEPRVVFEFTVAGETIVAIDMLADPDYLAGIELAALES